MGTQHGIRIPTPEQVEALRSLGALATTRADVVRLQTLLPSRSLAERLSATDRILLRQLQSLQREGLETEGIAILRLWGAGHIILAAERRAA